MCRERALGLTLKLNFLATLAGALGSLVFSELMMFPPCTLCWYQRICLYPLVVIFAVAILTEDRGYRKYAFPLALIGLGISIYHNLIYFGVISEALAPCTKGASCSSRQLELFGFVTIPLLAFTNFVVVVGLLFTERLKFKGSR